MRDCFQNLALWLRQNLAVTGLMSLAAFNVVIEPAQAVFRRLEISAVHACDVELSQVKNIPYQCWQFEDSSAKLPVWKHALGFQFGHITLEQWTLLKEAYRFGSQSAIAPYNPDHDYWLVDFLPPWVQATNRHRFVSQIRSATQGTILANCWGTTFESLRLTEATSDNSAYLMMVPPDEMLQTFEQLSTQVEDIQPGDILLISHRHGDRIYLDHSALLIDEQVMYEKAGAGDAVPYRITDMATLHTIWRPDVFDYQIRRPKENLSWPHPITFQDRPPADLSSEPQTLIIDDDPDNPSQQGYYIFSLPALEQYQGRAILPSEAYNPVYYQHPRP